VKPQRPSPEIKYTPANENLPYTSTTYKNTHRHPHNTEYMQEKLLLFILKMANACFYKGVLELSLALLLQPLQLTTK
jgi:hypothetical protein